VVIELKLTKRRYEAGIFRRLNLFSKDLRPVFRELRKPVLADQRDHRQKRSGPSGRWPDRAATAKSAIAAKLPRRFEACTHPPRPPARRWSRRSTSCG
jgi:hypothetical protein